MSVWTYLAVAVVVLVLLNVLLVVLMAMSNRSPHGYDEPRSSPELYVDDPVKAGLGSFGPDDR